MKKYQNFIFETMPVYVPGKEYNGLSGEINRISADIAKIMIRSLGFEARDVPCMSGVGVSIATSEPDMMDKACRAYDVLSKKCWSYSLTEAAAKCLSPYERKTDLGIVAPGLAAACEGAKKSMKSGDIDGALGSLAKFRASSLRERTL